MTNPQIPVPAPAAKTPTYRVRSITVSMEISDKEYGNGNSGYASLSASIDDGNVERMADVVDAGIEMFVAAWETILGGKVAAKVLGMKGEEFSVAVGSVRKRMSRVKALLRDARSYEPAGNAAPEEKS
jgi:hypothetical protein